MMHKSISQRVTFLCIISYRLKGSFKPSGSILYLIYEQEASSCFIVGFRKSKDKKQLFMLPAGVILFPKISHPGTNLEAMEG